MAQQTSIVDEGVDRFNEAFESLDKEFQRLQKEFQSQRKSFEKRTRKQVKQMRRDFDKSTVAKRVRSLRSDVTKQIERGVDDVLGALQIASKSDLQRIDRKLGRIDKKLKQLEKLKSSNGSGARRPTAQV